MSGFLSQVGDDITLETDSGVVHIERKRIAGIRLSNEPVDPRGARLWLSDGTVAPLNSIEIDPSGTVQVRLIDGQTQSYYWSPIQGIMFDAARLKPLSSLAPQSQEASGNRRFAPTIELRASRGTVGPAPALDAWDVVIPGPMVIRYALVEGTRRFGASAQLDVGTEPWGDCEFVVRVDGVEVKRARLWSGSGAVAFNVETPGRVLEIEVEPGLYGPINDRVVLSRPLLLVEQDGR